MILVQEVTKSPSFSCAPRPYARRSEQVWSDVQARSGAETPGTPNASGTIFSYKRMCAQKNRQVWSFVFFYLLDAKTPVYPCSSDQALGLFCALLYKYVIQFSFNHVDNCVKLFCTLILIQSCLLKQHNFCLFS